MAPSRRKGASKAASAAAARRQWKVGDLVLAKVKGFPAWPATVRALCENATNCLLSLIFVFAGSRFWVLCISARGLLNS